MKVPKCHFGKTSTSRPWRTNSSSSVSTTLRCSPSAARQRRNFAGALLRSVSVLLAIFHRPPINERCVCCRSSCSLSSPQKTLVTNCPCFPVNFRNFTVVTSSLFGCETKERGHASRGLSPYRRRPEDCLTQLFASFADQQLLDAVEILAICEGYPNGKRFPRARIERR